MGSFFSSNSHDDEVLKTIVLFGPLTPGLSSILDEHQLKPVPSSDFSSWVTHIFRHPNEGLPITLVRTVDFESSGSSDFNKLLHITSELERYMSKMASGKTQCSFSAIYLQPFTDKPTEASQRNLKASIEICRILNLSTFFIAPVTPPSCDTLCLRKFRKFYSSSDVESWKEFLPPSECQNLSQLADLVIQRASKSCWKPSKGASTAAACSRIFQEYESICLADEQVETARALDDLELAKQEARHYAEKYQTIKGTLQNTKARYESLLAQLNLRDNNEISGIVLEFEYLNDKIDSFSLDFTSQLPEDCISEFPDTQVCHDPARLRKILGRSTNPLLVLQSSEGVAVATGTFLQLFIGSVICETIHSSVFEPFYPYDQKDPEASAKLQVLTTVYKELRLRDPQMQSAKWRVDTVSALRNLDVEHASRARQIVQPIAAAIETVFLSFFGHEPTYDCTAELEEIVNRALDLNFKLKTEVIHLGDFHTKFFQYDHPFDGSLMRVLEAQAGDPAPSHIISTCGLGVCCSKAVGEGRSPDISVVLKAIVADEELYK
ncbi:hypothetical protein BDV93DRAFT_610436 [Ceratobasidium sp. AG-I]|nr:hypothetical protein BDV93DRAFT_610436 [Ceratobasidium sp. AG-I]